MKKYIIAITTLLASLLLATTAQAVDITGQWQGSLQVGQQAVPIIFNVKQAGAGLAATMDSPLQGAKGIPVESVEVNDDEVVFNIKVAGARYEARFVDDKLIGNWKQSGQSFVLEMLKGVVTTVKKN